MPNHRMTLRSGRAIGVAGLGDPIARRLVILCHPAPGAGGFDPDPVITNRWGVHLVGLDRPGYGASDPLPVDAAPSFGAVADDIAEYVRAADRGAQTTGLDYIRTIGVVGWGVGGLVAMALAARHAQLVDRLALVGTQATPGPPAFLAGEEAEWERAIAAPPAEGRAILARLLKRHDVGPDSVDLLTGSQGVDIGADPAGEGWAEMGARTRIAHMVGAAFAQGRGGLVDDLLAAAAFDADPGRIEARTLVLSGREDDTLDPKDARRIARRIPHAKVEKVSRGGHAAIIPAWERILEHVAPDHGGVSAELRADRDVDESTPRMPRR